MCYLLLGLFSPVIAAEPPTPLISPVKPAPVDVLIPWLLQEDHELREIPFSEVVFAATGKRVLALDLKTEADRELVQLAVAQELGGGRHVGLGRHRLQRHRGHDGADRRHV